MNSALQYNTSPYAPFMQETKVDLGNGIQLHVEIGGDNAHPTIILIRAWVHKCCFGLIFSANL